jgi:hypothetical protein
MTKREDAMAEKETILTGRGDAMTERDCGSEAAMTEKETTLTEREWAVTGRGAR